MDVRCDRCETEYELDDAIVTDAGASVQCTTCGHTFIVTRPASVPLPTAGITPPGGLGDTAGPNVPEWTLSTDDGKVHRFRDLNTLQKWIVERKVTRSDHISRSGGPWLSLGDVVELAPFFSVVDEADRARSSKTGFSPPAAGAVSAVRARTASGQFRSTSAVTPPPVPVEARRVSEDGPTVPNRPLPGFGTEAGAATTPQPGIRQSQPRLPGTRTPDERASSGFAGAGGAGGGGAGGGGAGGGGAGGTVGRHRVPAPRPPARTELVFGPNITEESRALEADFLRPSNRGRNVVVGLAVVVLAAGGGYWWWAAQQSKEALATAAAAPVSPSVATGTVSTASADLPGSGPGGAPAGSAGASPGASAGSVAPGTPSVAGANGEKSAPTNGGTGGSPVMVAAGGKPASNVAPPGGVAAPPSPGAAPSNAPNGVAGSSDNVPARRGGPAATTREGRGHAAAGTGKAGSYDRLVADADRLLDRGKSAKADKLYAQALATRPDGVAALTGSAYVLLDRQRHFKAIETFRRALAVQPGFGPALFGIAESYRARGDSAQALAAYRQYLAVAPSGADAPAARRQIKDLEAGAPPAPTNQRPTAETPSSTDQDP